MVNPSSGGMCHYVKLPLCYASTYHIDARPDGKRVGGSEAR